MDRASGVVMIAFSDYGIWLLEATDPSSSSLALILYDPLARVMASQQPIANREVLSVIECRATYTAFAVAFKFFCWFALVQGSSFGSPTGIVQGFAHQNSVSRWCPGVPVVSPAVSRWCPGSVPVVSLWCLGGDSVVSRWCPGGVPVVSLWCPGSVPDAPHPAGRPAGRLR